jgi:hypothetical protein
MPVYILLYPLAVILIAVGKAIAVQREIASREYKLRNFGLFSFGWLLWTLPGITAVCSEIGCGWSLRFGWFARFLHQLPLLDQMRPAAMITILGVAYAVLTMYFVGHCLGWTIYGLRALTRSTIAR